MTAVLIDPELCSSHRLSIWDLSQIKTELLVVSSLVRKIFIFLDWGRKYFMMNFIFTGSEADQKYDFISCVLLKRENMVALTHRKIVIYHIVFYIPGPIQTF